MGYYVVHPPAITTRRWDAGFDPKRPPEAWGYVHPRWNQRAVVAMADGHSETLSERELQDMQYWANTANRPDWTLRPLSSH